MVGARVIALTDDNVGIHGITDVPGLLLGEDVLVWVDIPECSDEAVTPLTEGPGLPPADGPGLPA